MKIALSNNAQPGSLTDNLTPRRHGLERHLEALLQGFAQLPHAVEVHVARRKATGLSTGEIARVFAPNIHFHSVFVPKIGWWRTVTVNGYLVSTWKEVAGNSVSDIAHGQGTELDCGISSVLSGFPNVLTIHGNIRIIAKLNGFKVFSFYWMASRLEAVSLIPAITRGELALRATHRL